MLLPLEIYDLIVTSKRNTSEDYLSHIHGMLAFIGDEAIRKIIIKI